METKEMIEIIRRKRESLADVKEEILSSNKSIEDKVVEAVFILPSQSYGMFMKDLVKESLGAIDAFKRDGYHEEYGCFNIKFWVSNNDVIKAKQCSIYDEVDNYILINLNYVTESVNFYAIPKTEVIKMFNNRPDHGSVKKGYTEEYSARFLKDEIEKYKIELR